MQVIYPRRLYDISRHRKCRYTRRRRLALQKIVNLRVFDDENGVMNKSILDINGNILVISQFTLHASYKKGNRPSYIYAAKPDIAIPLYEYFCQALQTALGKEIGTESSEQT